MSPNKPTLQRVASAGRRSISVLVCSGNLGNAQPDPESWAAWIPCDGIRTDVVPEHGRQARYPLPQPKRRKKARIVDEPPPLTTNDDTNDNATVGSSSALPNVGSTNNCAQKFSQHLSTPDFDPSTYQPKNKIQFDMIVLGMQEATFEPSSETNDSLRSDESSNHLRLRLPVVHPVMQTMANWTTNRDYTRKPLLVNKSNGNKNNSDSLSSKRKMVNVSLADWSGGTLLLHTLLDHRLPSYTRIVSYQRGQMRLEIYVRNTLNVKVLHVKAQNTGRGGLANKGGITAELLVTDDDEQRHTRVAFTTCHLEAHEGPDKYQARCRALADILHGTRGKRHDVSLTAHYSFVLGDLNFRTDLRIANDEAHQQEVLDLVQRADYKTLYTHDELRAALAAQHCLVGYKTLPCHFPPTFKLQRQAGYDYLEKRRPSYTDRIVWKHNHHLEHGINVQAYEPIDDFTTSDHKPIRGAFEVELNAPLFLRSRAPKQGKKRDYLRTMLLLQSKRQQDQEYLHLFVTNMSCQIDQPSVTHDPYLCLVSSPYEAIKTTLPWWKSWLNKNNFSASTTVTKHGIKTKTLDGWPRTSTRPGSNPDWQDAELHAEIYTHYADGTPRNLTGALLHLTLMGQNRTGDDVQYGTCSLNLAELIRLCSHLDSSHRIIKDQRKRRHRERNASIRQKKREKQNHWWQFWRPLSPLAKQATRNDVAGSTEDDDHSVASCRSMPNLGGHKDVMARKFGVTLSSIPSLPDANIKRSTSPRTHSKSGTANYDVHEDDSRIYTLRVDEPLLKNGVVTGHIRCHLETWWITEDVAQSLLGMAPATLDAANKRERGGSVSAHSGDKDLSTPLRTQSQRPQRRWTRR